MHEEPRLSIDMIEAQAAEDSPQATPAAPFPADVSASWVYWSPMDTAANGIPDEWVWERLRDRRNALISESDWRMVPDAAWDTAPWVAYRQALRDLPDTTTDPRSAEWPVAP